MLISAPFLPARLPNEADDAYLDRCMVLGAPGDGSFPVSADMNWHGGVHLTAPGRGADAVVRAIADGTVQFVRPATARSSDPAHPLNYRGGWTDDGCIVLRHQTDIGADSATGAVTRVVFFSVYMHLTGVSALAVGARVFRKDALGAAGSLNGVAGRIHFEMVCDDANVQALVGRSSPQSLLTSDGRADANYGAVWFLCPVGTPFFAAKPAAPPAPLPAPAATSTDELIVRLEHRTVDAVLSSHRLDGTPLGAPQTAQRYCRNLDVVAAREFPNSPSAGLEVLRFGRVLGPDVLAPVNAANWQEVAHPAGVGFVDLNATGVRRFSDADFPSWEGGPNNGWVLVDGSASADSRAADPTVIQLLGLDPALATRPHEAVTRLSGPGVLDGLARKLAKFPSEWEAATLDARFGWLKTDPRVAMAEPEFQRFRAHAQALCFWVGAQPGLAANHWHLHPREAIRRMSQCCWLSDDELIQCLPRAIMKLRGAAFVREAAVSAARARQLAGTWALGLNLMMRRYLISQTPQRLAHFFAQVAEESGFLSAVKERLGERQPYAPLYGRGLIQTTGPVNYGKYGNFRRFPRPPALAPQFAALGWDPDDLIARDDNNFNARNSADTAGFFWTNNRRFGSNGNGLADAGTGYNELLRMAKFINGQVPDQNVNGLDTRLSTFLYLKYVLLDPIRPATNIETVTFDWRTTERRPPAVPGSPRPPFVRGTHTIDFPLDPQRP